MYHLTRTGSDLPGTLIELLKAAVKGGKSKEVSRNAKGWKLETPQFFCPDPLHVPRKDGRP
jgi:hypothetical protein